MSSTLEKNEIILNFKNKIHCSQIVVGQWAEELGLDEETAVRMAAPFGGGCMGGNVCGCVTGALMMIGSVFGHWQQGDESGNACMIEKTKEFCNRFQTACGSLQCKELVGYDFSVEGEMEKAIASGCVFQKCPNYVNTALEILDAMLEGY